MKMKKKLVELIFSWSLDDILRYSLYRDKVKIIPLTFKCEEDYYSSFVYPLLEETRAKLASSMKVLYRAPHADMYSLVQGDRNFVYHITVGPWSKTFVERGKERYKTLPGDLLIVTNGKPESVDDIKSVQWTLGFVEKVDESEEAASFTLRTSNQLEFEDGFTVIFLMNITTENRIWNSLHMNENSEILKEVLCTKYMVEEERSSCDFKLDNQSVYLLNRLDDIQKEVIVALCRTINSHNNSVQQIWGPPGTGKTTSISLLLLILLQLERRTLVCTSTNTAIVQLASRTLNFVKESVTTTTVSGLTFYCTGDILLFGNREKLKAEASIEEISLDYRVERISECLHSLSWKTCAGSMMDLLNNCVSDYHEYIKNDNILFIKFLRHRFISCALSLKKCLIAVLTHIPRRIMGDLCFYCVVFNLDYLDRFQSVLFNEDLDAIDIQSLLSSMTLNEQIKLPLNLDIYHARSEFVRALELLQIPLLDVLNRYAVKDFYFESASIIFCTTSTSYKLHSIDKKHLGTLNILVIDEASQVKKAESTIPLQLPGMKHAILIGDDCQLPAVVNSKVCEDSKFERSLFGRLSLLGRPRHLLKNQYRMHPSISSFPNLKFYNNRIVDAERVLSISYKETYLPGRMFGSYSFINVVDGREENDDDGRSLRNMVEVAIVIQIVKNLYKAWQNFKTKRLLTVGIISPYSAQVDMINDRIGHKYHTFEGVEGFSVKVKSIDGFQGGEEDIIILSTVRSNDDGTIGFLSSHQRTNVSLTRARHCLWILGNETTLRKSNSIWTELVIDANARDCLFDAREDNSLKTAIIDAKTKLKQLDELVNGNNILFKDAKWTVLFSADFKRSFRNLRSDGFKKVVMALLLKIASGWRPKNKSVDICCKRSSQIIKKFRVREYFIICTIDITREVKYTQVLKVWDICRYEEEIQKLIKRLEGIFSSYTDEYIKRCTAKLIDGKLEIPKCWASSREIIRLRYLDKDKGESEARVDPSDCRNLVENTNVSESLLLMKFYSLSDGAMSCLLSGRELDLPMQVTDEQREVILCPNVSFIIGRSGSGKTTILTMKLLENQKSFLQPSKGRISGWESNNVEGHINSDPRVCRQLFVTVSPRLCHSVKQHIDHLLSIPCNENSLADDIPETFVNIPLKSYPLVLTFEKFLIKMDATLGNSFFKRFEVRDGSHNSKTSLDLQELIQHKEVTFERFLSDYWVNISSDLTKKLDPSRVFTEIISHIKGGLQAGECNDGKLSREGYCSLAECRSSVLTKKKREIVYAIFQAYENMKSENGEFDSGDFVNDIHFRLKNDKYKGDLMDYVYVDEVQDLTMRQILLFKYICEDVDKGFIFAGDTAQTIARGIDFRFQDIKSLFYNEFVSTKTTRKHMSEIVQLKQNFRTHAGVLDLAQSVIDILCEYFSQSIDKLEPETSLITGESPVLLESGRDENAIAAIFGDKGTGFGADQVILVRDDNAKTELCESIGNNALVLTILECKGLEFQDVLLYNFFGTSPLKEKWRVIYGYMKKKDWLDKNLAHSTQTFSEERHSLLCSELKQLYVAITRTRQRLWFCESKESLSRPMFVYWKKRGLVQTRKLDASLAEGMKVASSPQEWLARGKKLFSENNFVMATKCFERAGDATWEKLAKASSLKASAHQIRGANVEAFTRYLREAAEIFKSIGKLKYAASCYSDSRDYEEAGNVYMQSCKDFDAAAESFTLAGCYSKAAAAYARGQMFSNCLSVCKKGNLFDEGLHYIQSWKDGGNFQSEEIKEIEQNFLQSCARHYHGHKDFKSMLKFVREFFSMESRRVFLRSLGCLDELLLLEEELGNYREAQKLARSCGDIYKEADLFEKAGDFEGATRRLCWYVVLSSLWGNGNHGWPLKPFPEREKICEKASTLASRVSDNFYNGVCRFIKVVISDRNSSFPELKSELQDSQQNGIDFENVFSIRKILDYHFDIHWSKYVWEDKGSTDSEKVFGGEFLSYWNCWTDLILKILESIKEANRDSDLFNFNLKYFGVMAEEAVEGGLVYLIVTKDADWLRNCLILRDGNRSTCDGTELLVAMRTYWELELYSVGIKVVETLKALHQSKGPPFHQSKCIIHLFEVSKFLFDHLNLTLSQENKKKLLSFGRICTSYLDIMFPWDWRKAVSKDLITLRKNILSSNLLRKIIEEDIQLKGFTNSTMGRVLMVLNEEGISEDLLVEIIDNCKCKWKPLFEKIKSGGSVNKEVGRALALEDNVEDYMSPNSFSYIVEHLIAIESICSGVFFMTRSSFLRSSFLRSRMGNADLPLPPPRGLSDITVGVLAGILKKILNNKRSRELWIKKSNTNCPGYHGLFVLKMVMLLCLVCLKEALDHRPENGFSKIIFDLLRNKEIAQMIPKIFVSDLLTARDGPLTLEVTAKAFSSVDDPLVVVCSETTPINFGASCAIFVDMNKSEDDIMTLLFTKNGAQTQTSHVEETTNGCDGGTSLTQDGKSNKGKKHVKGRKK